jgi:hypothetical protein
LAVPLVTLSIHQVAQDRAFTPPFETAEGLPVVAVEGAATEAARPCRAEAGVLATEAAALRPLLDGDEALEPCDGAEDGHPVVVESWVAGRAVWLPGEVLRFEWRP